ncbi:hypothetical protein JCM10914A_38290 [Paenibacillus sp. JCM 10914]|uniref:family 10 glycosylhydrolase n=1 Tax=Paenibacillus sp. JCM 10914 TaxID=1236974 RepID=UPI0003CC3FF8|nr:family 10 glycosylhydrolase [Paenibacillus sp. JCM 10914]GAE04540.1 predicted glycoside hydrolase [Paenibacillus sp. JCM 10914]
MKLRRWLLVLMMLLLCLPSVVPTAQAKTVDISILLDGVKLNSDVSPYILPKVYVTMVPTRVISEGLGAGVAWDQKAKTVTIRKDGADLKLTSGKSSAIVNGSPVALDASVQIKNGRVMVPLRFISENLGLRVEWNQAAQRISLFSGAVVTPPVTKQDEIRGAWISTVFNLDWPKDKSTAAQQQAQYIAMLDSLQEVGINTVYVQVRPAGDALYPSSLVPWSKVLTGIQGTDPGYDPLAFMIEETHKRNMEFHAWFNPFRANTDILTATLHPSHVALTHPEWIVNTGKQLYINPGIPDARQHIIDTIMEVVNEYDVDGIHLDDYFYPSNTVFNDDAAYRLYNNGAYTNLGDWRRGNINKFVKSLGESIHQAKPDLQYGISPFGVWRNQSVDKTGSDTKAGVTAYDSMYADVRTWIKSGWIDYVAPQLYWSMSNPAVDYDKLVDWWVQEVQGTGVDLIIGHAPYKLGTSEIGWQSASEIINQLKYNQKYPEITGSIFFRAENILNNPLGLKQLLQSYYK